MSASPQIAVISSSVDVQFASRLVTDLRAAGWNVLDVSKTDLADAGRHLAHLQDVETFVLVLSDEALRSAWLTHEIERVLALAGDEPPDPSRSLHPPHPPHPPRRVIPLRLMPLELPESLARLEPVDFATVVYDSALVRLQEVLRGRGAGEGNGAEIGDQGVVPSSMPAPQLEPALIGAATRDAGTTQTSFPIAAPSNGAPSNSAPAGEASIADPAAPAPPPVSPTAPMPQAPAPTVASSATPPDPLPLDPAAPSASLASALSVPDAPLPDASILDETVADETAEPSATQITASRFLRAEAFPPPRPDLDDVMFTVYAPGEIEQRARMRLLVYASRETRDALAQVAADADARLAGARGDLRPLAGQRPSALRPGARLSLVPVLPGFAFDPPAQAVRWDDTSVQRHELYLRATTARADVAARGSLRVFAGPLLLAEVPLAIMVREPGERSSLSGGYASAVARVYRRIFASYAPRDADLARAVISAAGSFADDYLRDAIAARGAWDDRHMGAIAQAEVFQLFWSEHAAHSPEVEREWRYAASIRAPRGYLRGLYWSARPHPVPAELRTVSFDALDPARAGLGHSLAHTLLGRK